MLRYLDALAAREGEIDIVLVLRDIAEEGVAILSVSSVCSILSVGTILAILASSLAQLLPTAATVIGDVPLAVFDFQLRCHAIRTICTVLAILAILAVATMYRDLVAAVVGKPLSVQSPVNHTVGVALCGNLRRVPVNAVAAVIDNDRPRLGEGNRIADLHALLHKRGAGDDVVVILQSLDDALQRCHIGVHLVAQRAQLLERIPRRKFYLRTVGQREYHVFAVGGVDALEERLAVQSSLSVDTILAILAGGPDQLLPTAAAVVGDIPIVVLDFQLRRHAIRSVSAVLTILTILTLCLDFIPTIISHPLPSNVQ